ncbi:MAG: hypothetical protein JXL80_01680 [Planctomycetes bacterium]|nr:hypothetical protein [Planctomycetota bacterium]
MAPRIRVLFAASGLVVVFAIAVVAYIATRSNPSSTPVVATAPDVPAVPEDKQQDEPSPIPPRPRSQRKSAVPATSPDSDAADEPQAPEPAADERGAEDKRRAAEEKAVREFREKFVRDFKLTEEQVELAEPLLDHLEGMLRSLANLGTEARIMRDQLRQEAQANGWTEEQTLQAYRESSTRFILEHQGELCQLVDNMILDLEQLRPHLTAEQMPVLDKNLRQLNKSRDDLLQGHLKGL